MFFSGFPRLISGLSYFPNLSELVIMDQPIKKIENLDSCTNLVSLWLCECELHAIEGLGQCGQLRHLYLYGNRISRIRNLESLRLLETLWLNDNQIHIIEGLDQLLILEELNLSCNKILSLGSRLTPNISLCRLLLSGNALDDMDDLLHLTMLPKLKNLTINGPDCEPNPLFAHPNYFLFLLYHLPSLRSLDSFELGCQQPGNSSVREAVSAIVAKKLLFYSMRLQEDERTESWRVRELQQTGQQCLATAGLSQLEQLTRLEAMLAAKTNGVGWDEERADILRHQERLRTVHAGIEAEKTLYESLVRQQGRENRDLLQMELSSCGNFRFEKCSGSSSEPRPVWWQLCRDLVANRYCCKTKLIETQRVLKLKNFLVEKRYAETVRGLTRLVGGSGDRQEENYLFVSRDSLEHKQETILELLRRMYRSGSDVFKLTNSVDLADLGAVGSEQQQTGVRRGRLLLVKCWLRDAEQWPDARPVSATVNSPGAPSADLRVGRVSVDEESQCSSDRCPKYYWYFRGSRLMVPEYVVDFQESMGQQSLMQTVFRGDQPTETGDSFYSSDKMESCELLLVSVRQRLFYEEWVEDKLQLLQDRSCMERLTSLVLTGCRLNSLASVAACTGLQELSASFNELTDLHGLPGQHLRRLDVSHNRLESLNSVPKMPELRTLLLHHNRLRNTRLELALLQSRVSGLNELTLSGNRLQKPQVLRLRIIGTLRTVRVLDGSEVQEQEQEAAAELAYDGRVSEALLLRQGRCEATRPRCLLLGNTAQVLLSITPPPSQLLPLIGPQALQRLTALQLDRQGLTRLPTTALELLTALRFLSVAHNSLERVEPNSLAACSRLEELCLDDNCLSVLEVDRPLTRLRTLSVSNNRLSGGLLTSGLGLLAPGLETLIAHSNRLTSLTDIAQACPGVAALYLANNRFMDAAELRHLRPLSSLVILDLANNPICSSDPGYRLGLVYHLSTLRALDGVSIGPTETSQARELLGGRLTLDLVRDKLGDSGTTGNENSLETVTELEMARVGLRSVDLAPAERLSGLHCLNLEGNSLTSLSGLLGLPCLRVLCLNNNCITIATITGSSSCRVGSGSQSLEVLHLGYNSIRCLRQLALPPLPGLRALFLQGNDLAVLDRGLEALPQLRELVLDQNRIKSVSETALCHNDRLQEVHLDDNRLKRVSGFGHLRGLRRLYLANNKLVDLGDLDPLHTLVSSLVDVSVLGNPLCHRHRQLYSQHHRAYLIQMLPGLLMIDGVQITEEERLRVEAAAMEEQYSLEPASLGTGTLSGNNSSSGLVSSNSLLPGIGAARSLLSRLEPSSSSSVSNNPSNISSNITAATASGPRKQRSVSLNNANPALSKQSLQLVANSRAVYFYDPMGTLETGPRLYLNKRK